MCLPSTGSNWGRTNGVTVAGTSVGIRAPGCYIVANLSPLTRSLRGGPVLVV